MTSFDQVARPPFSSNLSAPLVSTNMAAKFSSAQMAHSHYRQTSVASFASSLYLPVDPDNRPNLDDDADTYPSSDELFGVDHEEGDDYTISSRRHLSFSRYSTVFSQPPTPPRSTRSTMSLERSSSSLSLTSPPPRHGSADPGSNCSPSAWANRPAVIRTIAMTSATELPSPPSTARSSNEAAMSTAQVADQGVPIEKFEQLALEHLEQDRALLSMLQKLDEQKVRISQLTYALSRLRVLSNSACLLPRDADAPISGSTSAVQPRRLGAVIPKPLIVQQSTKSASSSTISGTGLSGPSQNEAVNQRRRAKQQLHEFALRRRPTRAAPKSRLGSKPAPETVKRRGWEWEGTRGSSSMVARDTMPRSAAMSVGHPNVTVRRPRRSEPVPQPIIKTPTRPPRPSVATSENAATPPRLASIFASPNRTPTQSRLSVHDSPNTQSRLSALFDSPIISLPPRKLKDKPLPLLPPTRPRKSSYSYELPPVPSPDHTTAHVTMVDRSRVTPPLPAEEIQHRLAATFAHFSHRVPSPTRRGTDVGPEDSFGPMDRREPDYLQEVFHRKWVAQVDEHAHQARGSWKSPLRSIKQRLVGGFGGGPGRKSSRASVSMSSSDDHGTSLDTPGYVHGLDTLQEKDDGDAKTKKSKKKSGKDKDKDDVPSTPKATKSTWRFSRLASSSS